jgi:hypothetical protein
VKQDDVVSKPFFIPEIVPKIEDMCEKFATQSSTENASASSA